MVDCYFNGWFARSGSQETDILIRAVKDRNYIVWVYKIFKNITILDDVIDQSVTYKMCKASRNWDVLKASCQTVFLSQENKRTRRRRYIHFKIPQAGFLWGILSRGLPPVSGTTKMDASPWKILPTSAEMLNIIWIFVAVPVYKVNRKQSAAIWLFRMMSVLETMSHMGKIFTDNEKQNFL